MDFVNWKGEMIPGTVMDMIVEGIKGGHETMLITFADEQIKQIELQKSEAPSSKIVDLLNEDTHQTLEVKTYGGKVSHINRIVKIKIS